MVIISQEQTECNSPGFQSILPSPWKESESVHSQEQWAALLYMLSNGIVLELKPASVKRLATSRTHKSIKNQKIKVKHTNIFTCKVCMKCWEKVVPCLYVFLRQHTWAISRNMSASRRISWALKTLEIRHFMGASLPFRVRVNISCLCLRVRVRSTTNSTAVLFVDFLTSSSWDQPELTNVSITKVYKGK